MIWTERSVDVSEHQHRQRECSVCNLKEENTHKHNTTLNILHTTYTWMLLRSSRSLASSCLTYLFQPWLGSQRIRGSILCTCEMPLRQGKEAIAEILYTTHTHTHVDASTERSTQYFVFCISSSLSWWSSYVDISYSTSRVPHVCAWWCIWFTPIVLMLVFHTPERQISNKEDTKKFDRK